MKSPSSEDSQVDALASQLAVLQGRLLWLAEEQPVSALLTRQLHSSGATYVSNRFEQVQQAQRAAVTAEFHDFEPKMLHPRVFDHVLIRVPKQRALMHHLLNLATMILAPGGQLWLAGAKGEGIKTHVQRAEQRLGGAAVRLKLGQGVSIFSISYTAAGPALDDQNYLHLRQLEFAGVGKLWTKPGVYGWDQIDSGSAWLAETVRSRYASLAGFDVLDLGCGYGYLAVQAASLMPRSLLATDNQAGAVACAQQNLLQCGVPAQVLADDCGSQLRKKFDLILCNPPFHAGFSTNPALHHKFLQAIARLLQPKGEALVVVNAFFRLQQAARAAGLVAVGQIPSPGGEYNLFILTLRENAGEA